MNKYHGDEYNNKDDFHDNCVLVVSCVVYNPLCLGLQPVYGRRYIVPHVLVDEPPLRHEPLLRHPALVPGPGGEHLLQGGRELQQVPLLLLLQHLSGVVVTVPATDISKKDFYYGFRIFSVEL